MSGRQKERQALAFDCRTSSRCRAGEDVCGAVIVRVRGQGCVTTAFLKGPGCGVRGNIPATFAARVFSSMAGRDEPFDEIVAAVAGTLPDTADASPSAFSLMRARDDGICRVVQSGMPPFVLLHKGKKTPVETSVFMAGRRELQTSSFAIKNADSVVLYSGGVAAGWTRSELCEFLRLASTPHITAQKIAELLINAAYSLSGEKPAEDLCTAVLRAARPPVPSLGEEEFHDLQNADAANI